MTLNYLGSRISNKLMRIHLEIIFQFGLASIYGNTKPRILMYHGVAPSSPVFLNHRHITPEIFEQHLLFIKKNFNVLTIEEYFERRISVNRKNVLITFDDGYKNNLEYALPLLEKHKIPGYFFVTGINRTSEQILWSDLHDMLAADSNTNCLETPADKFFKAGSFYKPFKNEQGVNLHDVLKMLSFIDKYLVLKTERAQEILEKPELMDYWKLLSDNEIIELDGSTFGFIGSHGFYHNNIGNLSDDDAKRELSESKKYLETLLNRTIDSIAYPDGSYNEESIKIAERMGFKFQFAVDYKHASDKQIQSLKDRVGLYDYETLAMQKYKLIR